MKLFDSFLDGDQERMKRAADKVTAYLEYWFQFSQKKDDLWVMVMHSARMLVTIGQFALYEENKIVPYEWGKIISLIDKCNNV